MSSLAGLEVILKQLDRINSPFCFASWAIDLKPFRLRILIIIIQYFPFSLYLSFSVLWKQTKDLASWSRNFLL